MYVYKVAIAFATATFFLTFIGQKCLWDCLSIKFIRA